MAMAPLPSNQLARHLDPGPEHCIVEKDVAMHGGSVYIGMKRYLDNLYG